MDNVLVFGVQVSILGISVVFLALALIIFAMKLLDRLTPWLIKRFGVSEHGHSHASEISAPAVEPDEVISPEVMVAISAAVAVAIGKRARITRIRYRSAQPGGAWSVQGRMTVMASHVTRR
jgi:Na+-transporting methylmalonyl-CoA/oxaloacetate decarboxylase gamma subunit